MSTWNILNSFKPGIPKRWLLFLASLVWACAGGILAARGYFLIMEALSPHAPRLELGLVGGVFFFLLLFRRISARHIRRIDGLLPERPCMFSFFNWRSYGMMALMIGLGIVLRKSRLIPTDDLGTFYISMGIPLLFSSVRFAHRGLLHVRGQTAKGE
jgi:hypothetical protein